MVLRRRRPESAHRNTAKKVLTNVLREARSYIPAGKVKYFEQIKIGFLPIQLVIVHNAFC